MHRTHVAAVVFDMDGTLLDSLPVVIECYRNTVLRFGGPELSSEEVIEAFAMGPAAKMLDSLIGRPIGSTAIAWYETLLTAEVAEVKVYPGIHGALAALAEHIPLGLFTAADTSAAELLLKATGLRPLLGPVIGADRVVRHKPAPDGLVAVCDAFGVSTHDVAYVGDGAADIEMAKACGALAVAAGWGHLHRDGRGADVTLQRPADLVELLPSSRR